MESKQFIVQGKKFHVSYKFGEYTLFQGGSHSWQVLKTDSLEEMIKLLHSLTENVFSLMHEFEDEISQKESKKFDKPAKQETRLPDPPEMTDQLINEISEEAAEWKEAFSKSVSTKPRKSRPPRVPAIEKLKRTVNRDSKYRKLDLSEAGESKKKEFLSKRTNLSPFSCSEVSFKKK